MASETQSQSSGGDIEENTHLNLIMQQLSILTQNVTDIRNLLLAQNEKLDACANAVTVLQQENMILSGKLQILEEKLDNTEVSAEMYAELRMRFIREKNVVIYGLPEETPNNDIQSVKDIINKITHPENINIKKVSRLGKSITKNSRPIKVEFSSYEDATYVLRNKFKAPRDLFPNIYIKKDLTPRQQKELSILQQQLNQRKSTGENNITIRYINNVPKIIPVNKKPLEEDRYKRPREEEVSPKMIQPKKKN